MVFYCCVKGCGNNTNNNKKNPSAGVSFHAFPSNSELKLKWLRAIGRPNWDPPNHIRICSVHFSYDQISHDRVRTRIMDHACPVNALPPNSNFEASNIEVCRICLAADMKLYTLEDGMLKTCLDSIAGFKETLHIEGLPQFVCYECAAHLMKCYKLVEKSMVAQATLLDIFAQNGKITKCLVRSQNRSNLNLSSDLSHNTTPTPLFEYQYNDQHNYSKEENLSGNDGDCEMKINFEEFIVIEQSQSFYQMENLKNEIACKMEDTSSINGEELGGSDAEMSHEQVLGDVNNDEKTVHEESEVSQVFKCEECSLSFESERALRVHRLTAPRHATNSLRGGADEGSGVAGGGGNIFSLLNLKMRMCDEAGGGGAGCGAAGGPRRRPRYALPADRYPKQCDHCCVTVKDRGEHWTHVRRTHQREVASYQPVVLAVCDTCGKGFQNTSKLRIHELRHGSPSVRCAQCPKVFYDKYRLAGHLAAHSERRPHTCRTCGRGFKLPGNRDRHQKVHTDEAAYECTLCAKKFKYSTSLNLHVRSVHQKIPPPPRKKRPRAKAGLHQPFITSVLNGEIK